MYLVFRVHDIQVEGCRQFAGELGRGPADQLAFLLGLTGIRMDVINDLAKSKYAGTYFFCHFESSSDSSYYCCFFSAF